METIQRKDLNWFSVVIATIFCILAGLGVGLVIKEIGYSVGQPISVLYSIVASIFFAIAIVIYMYVYSTIKK